MRRIFVQLLTNVCKQDFFVAVLLKYTCLHVKMLISELSMFQSSCSCAQFCYILKACPGEKPYKIFEDLL